jgi:adenylate cyclase
MGDGEERPMPEEAFYADLDRYNESGDDQRKTIEGEIWAKYGTEKCVLALDMSGFSLLTQKYGVIHYLTMVRRMQIATRPMVERHRGTVVKFEADNMFAMFDRVLDAVKAAVTINLGLDAMNTLTRETRDLYVSIGISHGRLLVIPDHDYYGDCVNLACKLGEDVAERQEILLTEDAYRQIAGKPDLDVERVEYSISGIQVPAYKVIY